MNNIQIKINIITPQDKKYQSIFKEYGAFYPIHNPVDDVFSRNSSYFKEESICCFM